MLLPDNFGPKHPLWEKTPPSKRNKWMMEHGHVFVTPKCPEPNPHGDNSSKAFVAKREYMEKKENTAPEVPIAFSHSHPDWRVPSKRNLQIMKMKERDREATPVLIIRKFTGEMKNKNG